jgi:hypothetical protein
VELNKPDIQHVYGVRTSGEKDSKGSREYKGGGRPPSLLALAGQRKFAGNSPTRPASSLTCDVSMAE